MIVCRDLLFKYSVGEKAITALDGIDLEINSGEYVAVMGPNGSGKSTLAKVLSGILRPAGGVYFFMDRLSTGNEGERLIRDKTGIVFQNPDNQMVAMTVESEIAFALENRGLPTDQIRGRIDRIVDIIGLQDLIQRPPQTLSGGERQKVIIASILITEPVCLILDEPTSLLDSEGRRMVLDLLAAVHEKSGPWNIDNTPPTLIHFTQFPDEALLSDRLILMDDGKISREGPPSEVFRSLLEDDPPLVPLPKLLKAQILAESRKPPQIEPLPEQALLVTREKTEAYRLSGIDYSYRLPWGDSIPALEKIECRMETGSVIGIIGPTGSGKSSLARILSFLMPPDKGRIRFFEKDVKYPVSPDIRHRTGMTFQFPEKQFFCETVYEELAFGLRHRNRSADDIDNAVRGSLKSVGLDYREFAGRDPFTLSGGEKRRIGIAITLSLDPDVIILDEPTSGLDGRGADFLEKMIHVLSAAGKSVIVISHNIEFILTVCDRIFLLEQGKIKCQTTVSDILSGDFRAMAEFHLTPYIEFVIDKIKKTGAKFEKLPPPERIVSL